MKFTVLEYLLTLNIINQGGTMRTQKYLQSKSLSIVLFLFVFMLYAMIYMTKSIFSAAMATIVEEGIMTKSQTGLITGLFWLVYAPFQIIGGFAVDKYSPYKLVMIGLFGVVISNLVIYLNQNYYVMIIAWMFNAAAQFGIWPGVLKIVSTQTAPEIRGYGVFWLLFSTSLGYGFSLLVASFVKRWQDNFLVSIISALIFIVAFAILNHFLSKKMITEEIEISEKLTASESQKTKMLPLALSSGLVVFIFLYLIRTAIDNAIKMLTPVMLMESYEKLPAAIATRISMILIVFSAVGTLLTGLVRNKITKNEVKAQILLYVICVLSLILACFVGKIHYIWLLAALGVAVVMLSSAGPFSLSYASVRFEEYGKIGTVSGILNAGGSIGCVLASYVFAKMSEVMSWQNVVKSWVGLIALCIVLCMIILSRWSKFIHEK